MYFEYVSEEADEQSDLRQLVFKKNNRGKKDAPLRVRWQRGVFVPEGGVTNIQRAAADDTVDRAYLACLDASISQKRDVSPSTGHAYAPSQFEKMPQANGLKSKALAAAQERLFAAGKIIVQTIGPPSRSTKRIVRAGDQ